VGWLVGWLVGWFIRSFFRFGLVGFDFVVLVRLVWFGCLVGRFCLFVGWLLTCLLDWLLGSLIGWSVGRSFGLLVGY
jgi:hypothetical protein